MKDRIRKVLALSFLGVMVLSAVAGVVGAATASSEASASTTVQSINLTTTGSNATQDSTGQRIPWWNSGWHYRITFTVDANNYARRWGRLIQYVVGIKNVANLDINSIRIVDGKTEIPSSYDPASDTVMFIMNTTLTTSQSKTYYLYYDLTTNGGKSYPNYGLGWVQPYIDAYQKTNQAIQDYKTARANYETTMQIHTIGGADVNNPHDGDQATVNGYDVHYDGVLGYWVYSEDIPNAFPTPIHAGDQAYYIVQNGLFFYYQGQQIYRDDQGNWYFSANNGVIEGFLYFNSGHYQVAVKDSPTSYVFMDAGYDPNFVLYSNPSAQTGIVGYGAWRLVAGEYSGGSGVLYENFPIIVVGTVTPYYFFSLNLLNPTSFLLFQDLGGNWHAKYVSANGVPHVTPTGTYRVDENIFGDWVVTYTDGGGHTATLAQYDASNHALSYQGNLLWYDQANNEYWLFDQNNNLVAFVAPIQKYGMYKDLQVIYTDGLWTYMDGAQVLGNVYWDQATGQYWVHYSSSDFTFIELDSKDPTSPSVPGIPYHGDYIIFGTPAGGGASKWIYASNNTPVLKPDLSTAINVGEIGNHLVYSKLVGGVETWYYFDGTVLGDVWSASDGNGHMVYWLIEGTDKAAFYYDEGSLWLYDGSTWFQYGPFDYNGQNIYLSSAFHDLLPSNAAILDEWSNQVTDTKWGFIRSWMIAHTTIQEGLVTYQQDVKATILRGVPDYSVVFSSTQPDYLKAYGSSLINLDGAIQIDSNSITRHNVKDYLNTFKDDLAVLAGVSDTMFGTKIAQYANDVSGWTDDQFNSFMSSMNRFMIMSEDNVPTIDANSFITPPAGYTVYDMNGIYSTGRAHDALKVIPIEMTSRYIGIFDLGTLTGYALASTASTPLNHFLMEMWQERIGSTYTYYMNVSFNTARFWEDTGVGSIHLTMPNNFGLQLVYLDGTKGAVPTTTILDELGAIPDVKLTQVVKESAVAVAIGTIFAPSSVQPNQDCVITVGIIGETTGAVKYTIDNSPTEYSFDHVVPFYIDDVAVHHWGLRANVTVHFTTSGTHKIKVVAYDTKPNTKYTKSVSINVSAKASDLWAWLSGILAAIAGLLGFAVIANKKKFGKRKIAAGDMSCLDGKCDL